MKNKLVLASTVLLTVLSAGIALADGPDDNTWAVQESQRPEIRALQRSVTSGSGDETYAGNAIALSQRSDIHQKQLAFTPTGGDDSGIWAVHEAQDPNISSVQMSVSPGNYGGPSNAAAVFVGGTEIFRIREGYGGYSPEQRAEYIQERINEALGHGPIYPSDITIAPKGPDYQIFVKGELIVTAGVATASANGETTWSLASRWADKLRRILPELTAPH